MQVREVDAAGRRVVAQARNPKQFKAWRVQPPAPPCFDAA